MPTFTVLAQIGITMRGAEHGRPIRRRPTPSTIDETKLDDALLNQTDAVRALFAFQMSSSSPDVVLAGLRWQHPATAHPAIS